MKSAALILFGVLAGATAAKNPADPYESTSAAMEASVETQRESVRRQVNSAKPVAGSFFTVEWPGGPPAQSNSPQQQANCTPIPPSHLQEYIDEVASREGLTPDLLRAVINRESAFQPCAVSSTGARGLMQLMPKTSSALGVLDPFDAKNNIDGGAKYLSNLLTRYGGDLALALSAYHAGPSRVDAYNGIPPIPETIDYVDDIMKALKVEPLPSPAGIQAKVPPG